jgi:Family of unknown function (DUF6493)
VTLSWDELDAAIEANDAAGVTELVLGATERERRACWAHVESLTTYSERRRLEQLGVRVLKLAIAGTAPSARELAERYWPGRDAPDTDARAAVILVARNPVWLARLAAPLLSNGRGSNWPLLRELARTGCVPLPEDRENYLLQMITSLSLRPDTVREMLDADPALLETEVYELFEHEECGALLAAKDHWVITRAARQTAGRSARGDGGDPPAQSWVRVLAGLACEGRLERARLLDLALAALVRDTTWSRKRWYARFVDVLSPTIDEMAERAGSYLALLAAADGPSTSLGQAAVEALLDADRLRPDELLPVADGPLLRREKAVALRQLKLLDRIAADPSWATDSVRVMATAFGHPRPDVQEKALALVGRHMGTLPPAAVEDLRLAAESCAPSLAPAVEKVLGVAVTSIEPVVPAWEPPEPPRLPDALTDDAALVEAAVSIMATNRDALLMERLMEGLLARADHAPDQLADSLAPAVAAARRAIRSYDMCRAFVGACVLVLVGERPQGSTFDLTSGSRTWVGPAPDLLARRFGEVLARLLVRHAGPLLSMPTDTAGRVAPADLAERERQLGPIDPESVAADAELARLRAGLATGRAGNDAQTDWRAPASYLGTRPDPPVRVETFTIRPDGTKVTITENTFHPPARVTGPFVRHWPFLWPHSPERAVRDALWDLRRDVDHEPTSFEPSVLVPLLAWLSQPSVEAGDWTAAAIAFGLGSSVALHRAAGVDTLLALDHGGRLTADQVVACTSAADEARVIKLNRVATCLAELLPASPRLTRDIALGVLPGMLQRGHRDAHRFLTVAADAVATAGSVTVPLAVVEVAERPGKSKLVTEARRLVAL